MTNQQGKIKEGHKQTEVGVIPSDWEVKKLGEIALLIASGKSDTKSKTGAYPIYGSTGVIGFNKNYDYNGEKILVARVGANAGAVNWVNGKYCVSDNTLMVELKKNYDFSFALFYLNYFNLNKLIFGSGQPLITGGQLKQLSIPLPLTKAEQTAIATALSDADVMIQSMEKLIAKKRLIKQGAMQELLKPKGGWVVKKLGEIAEIRSGGTPSTRINEYWNGDVLWCTPTDITSLNRLKYLFDTNRKITIKGLQNSSAELIPKNSIVMTTRATIGECAINRMPVSTNQGFKSFVPNECVDVEFLYYRLITLKNSFLSLCSGSTFLEISKSQIFNFELSVPKEKSEQTHIATILSDMDAEISTLETKLAKYKQIKQGMMQNLLTGKIRLV